MFPVLPDVIRVYVGPKMAAKSTKCDTHHCVFAKALKKKTGFVFTVQNSIAFGIENGKPILYTICDSAREQIKNFDNNGKVKAGHYTFKKFRKN